MMICDILPPNININSDIKSNTYCISIKPLDASKKLNEDFQYFLSKTPANRIQLDISNSLLEKIFAYSFPNINFLFSIENEVMFIIKDSNRSNFIAIDRDGDVTVGLTNLAHKGRALFFQNTQLSDETEETIIGDFLS